MGRHRPSKTDRKKLSVRAENLFTMLSLRFGKPNLAAASFVRVKGRYTFTGIGAWIKETPEGQEFANFIAQCGDAKRRAAYWFRRWDSWYKEQARGQPKP